MDLIRSLPLFPLGIVLYPDERRPLHIFEPRYREMTAFCLEEEVPFGIVYAEEQHMAEVGSTALIDRVTRRYDDGQLDILVTGETRFRIQNLHEQERSYLTADVELIGDPAEAPEQDLKERVITQHMKLLELAGHTVRPSLYEGVSRLSYVLAQNAGLQTSQKQRLLEMLTEKERVGFLAEHFETLIPRIEQQEDLRRKISSNGHFKDFPRGSE